VNGKRSDVEHSMENGEEINDSDETHDKKDEDEKVEDEKVEDEKVEDEKVEDEEAEDDTEHEGSGSAEEDEDPVMNNSR